MTPLVNIIIPFLSSCASNPRIPEVEEYPMILFTFITPVLQKDMDFYVQNDI